MESSESMMRQKYFDALRKLIEKVKPETSTCLYGCIVTLFTAATAVKEDEEEDCEYDYRFVHTGKICMMNIDVDRLLGSNFLRFYDLDSLKLLCEVEMYYGFAEAFGREVAGGDDKCERESEREREQYFYAFDYLEEGRIGVLFRNKEEADTMCMKIKAYAPKLEQLRMIQAKAAEEYEKSEKEKSIINQLSSLSTKLINTLIPVDENELEEDHNSNRGHAEIINVTRYGTVTFDMKNGEFKGQNLSPEIEKIFKQSIEGQIATKEQMELEERKKLIFDQLKKKKISEE